VAVRRQLWSRVGAALLGVQAAVFAYYCYASVSFLPAAATVGPDEPHVVLQQAVEQGSIAALAAVLSVFVARGSVVVLYAATIFTACESVAALLWAAVGFLWGPVLGLLYLVLGLPFSAPAVLAWPTLAAFVIALRANRRKSDS
jgi:hypothetical protein